MWREKHVGESQRGSSDPAHLVQQLHALNLSQNTFHLIRDIAESAAVAHSATVDADPRAVAVDHLLRSGITVHGGFTGFNMQLIARFSSMSSLSSLVELILRWHSAS